MKRISLSSNRSKVFLFSAFLLLPAGRTLAAACGPPTILMSLAMTPMLSDNRMLVSATVNGVSKNLLLDTAGGGTSLTNTAVDSLHLHILSSEGERLLDANGNVSARYVQLDSLGLGGMVSHNPQIMLTPDPKAGVAPAFDGVLAIDLMTTFDVELDFAARRVNYLSPNHCDGQVVYWPAAAIGVTPMSLHDFGQQSRKSVQHQAVANAKLQDMLDRRDGLGVSGTYIRTKVTIDGKDLTATVDTGSAYSTMNAAVAKSAFGVTETSPGSVLTAAGTPDAMRGFEYRFHTLSFGGVTVTNPRFLVGPNLIGKNDDYDDYQTGSRVRRADDKLASDVTIGMNILSHLHVYIAFKEKNLYFTAADAKATQSPANASSVPP